MGPRRFRRGNFERSRSNLPRCERFNGAATFPSRKCLMPTPSDRLRGRFNGAATFPSRKCLFLRRAAKGCGSFNGAATFPSRKCPARIVQHAYIPTLQWGRDVSVAEITGYPYPATNQSALLQWGRDVSVAEITQTWGPIRRYPCFNGAATFPSRKFLSRIVALQVPEASMGPRRFRRGNLVGLFQERQDARASMGPRRFRRGNFASVSRAKSLMLASMGPRRFRRGNVLRHRAVIGDKQLQWGRDVSVAEISQSR